MKAMRWTEIAASVAGSGNRTGWRGREGLMHTNLGSSTKLKWDGVVEFDRGRHFYDNNNLVRIRSQQRRRILRQNSARCLMKTNLGEWERPNPQSSGHAGQHTHGFLRFARGCSARMWWSWWLGPKRCGHVGLQFYPGRRGRGVESQRGPRRSRAIVCDEDQMDGTAELPILRGKGLDARVDGIEV
jgi:hypothetical protein